jgi:hypothetical protein
MEMRKRNLDGERLADWVREMHDGVHGLADALENRQVQLQSLIAAIESCAYSCEAGPLANNADWVELKRLAGMEAGK